MDMILNPFSLEGKTILVTGASSGIGRGCAEMLSRMGATIVTNGRNEDRLKDTMTQLKGEGHTVIVGDLTREETIEKIVSEVSHLDGAVFAAGIVCTKPFLFSSKESFQEVFDVNFNSTIELFRQLVKRKKLTKGASAVMISSAAAMRIAPGNGIYSCTKAALNFMVRQCAIELAPQKIRVNAICPGMVETPLVERYTETIGDMMKDASIYPLKRFGTTEDIANGTIYLLSNASSWVTGQCICIDGGITAY